MEITAASALKVGCIPVILGDRGFWGLSQGNRKTQKKKRHHEQVFSHGRSKSKRGPESIDTWYLILLVSQE
jgi:hypothetical protein